MSIVPITLRLATAICCSGSTSAAAMSSRLARAASRLRDQVDLAEADRVQPCLPRREDRRQVRLDVRDRGRELGDRRRERTGGDDHDDDEQDDTTAGVDEDRRDRSRQARDDVDDAA